MRERRILLSLIVLLLFGVSFGAAQDAVAGPENAPRAQPTAFPTPTPGPDGRIIYIVQERDTFYDIAAIAGITLQELYALNGIQPGDFALPGQELLLGLAGPAEPTQLPDSVTPPTSVEPSPTPLFNTGEICVLLFLDENGNARLEETEGVVQEGQISVIDVNGTLTAEATTGDDPEGTCFEGLEAGDYSVSAAVPPEYNPTTTLNLPIRLQAGDIKYVQFGAQPSAAISDQVGDDFGNRSIWFGAFGVLLLLAAAGLAYYASRYGKRSANLP
jgi:hypothetical protein